MLNLFSKHKIMIKKVIIQQKEELLGLLNKEYLPRIESGINNDFLNSGLIKLISGARRAGKSVLALQLLKETSFAYLNFDDDLLLKNFDEDLLTQALYEIYPDFNYLFLDEIQNLPDWELWVNKLYRRGFNLIITGSNSRLLSNEMASTLTGRYLQINVHPFSFKEFVDYSGLKQSDVIALPSEIGKLSALFIQYQTFGGFPETVLNPAIHKNYLSSLFDSVLLRDIVKRFKIRQTQQLYDLSVYLLSNYTNQYSFNQLKADLGFNSVATVQKFCSYLEESFLFYHLPRYDKKVKLQQKSLRKCYIIDNGFVKARSFELSPNYGRLLENLVFTELLRRGFIPGQSLFYYKTRNDREVDFVCRDGYQIVQLIQVSYDISQQKTLKRELDSLVESAQELNCNNLLLINTTRKETIEHRDSRIELVLATDWFLGISK